MVAAHEALSSNWLGFTAPARQWGLPPGIHALPTRLTAHPPNTVQSNASHQNVAVAAYDSFE